MMSLKQTKIKLLLTALMLTGAAPAIFAQTHISLQQAVDLALQRNLTVKQAQFNEALAQEDYRQAKNNRLPALNGSGQGSYNFGRSVNQSSYQYTTQAFYSLSGQAQASVTVFQGGQLNHLILQNKMLLEADKSNTAKVKNDLTLNVVTTFLSVLSNKDLVTAAEQQVAIAKLTLDRAQKSFKAGNATVADISQYSAQLSTAQYNLTSNQNLYDISMLTLKQYMEMPADTNIVVDIPDVSKISNVNTLYNANTVISTALKVNPDVQLAENQQKVYAEAVKVAKGAYYPTLSFFTGIGSNYSSVQQNLIGSNTTIAEIGKVQGTDQSVVTKVTQPIFASSYPFFSQFGNNYNGSIGLNLQIPIFNRFQARTTVRKALINYQNAEVSTQLAKTTLTKTITQAVLDLQAAEKKYQSAQETYQANKDAFNAFQQRYNVGLANSLDYNTSLTNLNKAQNDMILAKYELIFRAKVIDYYLGNPIIL